MWRGTKPSQAANARPDRNACGLPIAATAPVAVSMPTPGVLQTSAGLAGAVPELQSLPDNLDLLVRAQDPRPLIAQTVHDHGR